MRATPRYRYEDVADFIAGLLDAGKLPPASRVPSLREIPSYFNHKALDSNRSATYVAYGPWTAR
jgi:hypothetical protein